MAEGSVFRVRAEPAPCAMCGATRRFGATGILCESNLCSWRHASLPPERKCRVCTRPLDVASMASGVCASATCREEWLVRRPLAAARKAREALLAIAVRRRDRHGAQRGIPAEERASYALAVLPRNDDRSSRLPPRRRAKFEQHLRQNLAIAWERLAAGDAVEPRYVEPVLGTRSPAAQAAELQLLGAGCSACRGDCCRAAGDHAFNSADTMMQYLDMHSGHDDDTIVTRYLSWIGERTMTNGCVFQQEDGCSLPRDLRADVCNRFYCDGQRMIRHQFREGDPVRAYFVHEQDHRLVGRGFVDVPVEPATPA